MRNIRVVAAASVLLLVPHHAKTAETKTVAVFTKNSTNPAYEAFRIAADQVARGAGLRIVHFVPSQPEMSTSRRRWWSTCSRENAAG